MDQSTETKHIETARDHSLVRRPADYYATRLNRSKLELLQVAAELDMIDEIPTWKKLGMMLVRGQKYSELMEYKEKLNRDSSILRKRIEMATDLMNGDTTFHSEAGFDGFESVHNLKYIDLTAEENQQVEGQDIVIDINRPVSQTLESAV